MFTKLSEITQCNGYYAVQGHSKHRFWYQSKAHIRLHIVINTNLGYLQSATVSKLAYGWLLVKFSLARGGCLSLTLSLRVIPCQYRHKWHIAKTRFFGLHFRCRKHWCIFNHFYVIRPESNRVRWNFTAVRAITPFKVIQGHRVWYQSKAAS